MQSAGAFPARTEHISWRTPVVILACGCLISVLGFGPRAAFGFFLSPMSTANGWGRDVFALALAIQALLWGAAQPFAGALADRFGAGRVLCAGAAIYSLGLVAMAQSTTPGALYLSAGLLIGFGLAGSSFTLVIGAFGALLPRQWRSLAFGAGTAAGSFGQFLFSPLAVALIDAVGWFTTLALFSAAVLAIVPLSLALNAPERNELHQPQTPIAMQRKRSRRHWRTPSVIAAMACWYSAFSLADSSCFSSPYTCRRI
jgi:MFS family permease